MLPPVVDTVGITASGTARPKRVDIVTRYRRQLLDDLSAAATQQAATGLVGVCFLERDTGLAAPGNVAGDVVELTVTAIPVTVTVHAELTQPFSTAIEPVGLATLLRGGWVPVKALTAGTTQTRLPKHRHDDASAATSRTNREITGPTDMIQRARRLVRDQLKAAATALGADGVLLNGHFDVTWSSTHHLVQVSATATAITRWRKTDPPAQTAVALPITNHSRRTPGAVGLSHNHPAR